jgi:hypothetical protein
VKRQRVGRHRFDLARQHFRLEAVLLDGARPTRFGHLASIGSLVIVGSRRERDEDRRTPGGGQLGNRRSSCAADYEMRVADLFGHVLDIGHQLSRNVQRRILAAHPLDFVRPALLHDLQAVAEGLLEQAEALGDDVAQHRRALASTGDEDFQRRDVVERRERQLAQTSNLLANRIADRDRLGKIFGLQPIDLVISSGHRLGIAGEQTIDAPQHRVLLMQHGRDVHRTRRQQRRESGIAPEADDDVRLMLAIKALGLAPALENGERRLGHADRPAAQTPRRKDMHRHILKQPGIAGAACVGNQQDAMAAALQFCRERMGRDHVATGSSCRQNEVHAARLSPLHFTT